VEICGTTIRTLLVEICHVVIMKEVFVLNRKTLKNEETLWLMMVEVGLLVHRPNNKPVRQRLVSLLDIIIQKSVEDD
jgi:hypothetical protein